MAKKLKIGLFYSFKKDWIAGSYYILNLIHALNLLSDENKPELNILSYSEEEFIAVKQTGYPYLKYILINEKNLWASYNLIERLINKLLKPFFGKNIIYRKHTHKRLNINLDMIFPATNQLYFSNIKNKLFWIPDLQEHFLPQFFTKKEIIERKNHQQALVDANAKIIFSSKSSQADFFQIYSGAQNKTFVLPFAVSHSEEYKKTQIESLLMKFNLPDDYYFCANQFWAHKNHITVLKALSLLKQKDKNITVAFSGNQSDYRNPHFFEDIIQYVSNNNLETNTRFLGFIDRNEQLALMENSKAIIQPSLFEGWSTVVEDAKSLNKPLILSDIPVHREQIDKNVHFFTPLNEIQLAKILENYYAESEVLDYSQDRIRFAETFYSIVKNCH